MPMLANHRRELFAQLLFQGFSAVDAHENAGYKRHDGNACTLAKHPEVQARLEEIRSEREAATGIPFGTNAIAARAKVTPETLIDEAEQARVGAMKNGQFSAAITAVKEKSILSGHRIERQEIGPPGAFDAMTDDELERALIERLKALGLTPDGERTPDTTMFDQLCWPGGPITCQNRISSWSRQAP